MNLTNEKILEIAKEFADELPNTCIEAVVKTLVTLRIESLPVPPDQKEEGKAAKSAPKKSIWTCLSLAFVICWAVWDILNTYLI